jgi:transcriptional regulator with XRE-family HTH domain
MPNTDAAAKVWQLELASRVGNQIKRWRTDQGLSTVQLAERTAALGYPVTRVAISKIENNMRSGKLDIAELFVIARALDVPPLLMMFPDLPDGRVHMLPNEERRSIEALLWASGEEPLSSRMSGGTARRFDQLDESRDYHVQRLVAERSRPTHLGMEGLAHRAVSRLARKLRARGYVVDFPEGEQDSSDA